MKLWLNHILACPDDKAFPLILKIFSWDSSIEYMGNLLKAYNSGLLINFKDEKKQMNIQVFDNAIFDDEKVERTIDSEKVHEENRRLTSDFDFKNIISIFLEDNKLKMKDHNVVSPSSLKEYFDYYLAVFAEFEGITEESAEKVGSNSLKLVKSVIYPKIKKLSEEIKFKDFEEFSSGKETDICDNLIDVLKPILQGLLFLNYYMFLLEIDEGMLICPECKRWFPIIKTIPRLLPKNMTKTQLDDEFKERWNQKFPNDVK